VSDERKASLAEKQRESEISRNTVVTGLQYKVELLQQKVASLETLLPPTYTGTAQDNGTLHSITLILAASPTEAQGQFEAQKASYADYRHSRTPR
jgi:hypothetical protein